MIKNKIVTLLSFSLFFALTGCNTMSSVQDNDQHINPTFIKIATPKVVTEEDQASLISVTQMLMDQNISGIDRSKLLYQRGEIYDRLGLDLLSLLSFMGSIQVNNELAPSYSYGGVFLALNGKYLEAYDAFDASLELDPRLYVTYLNRGIALYYGSRARAAVNDLDKYYRQDLQDPYRQLWLYIVESRVYPDEYIERLKKRFRLINVKSNYWISSLIEVIIGQRTEADFWEHVLDGAKKEEIPERLCEAYFYLGKYHEILGERTKAIDYYKLSAMTNVSYYMEYRYALKDIELLENNPNGSNSDFPNLLDEVNQ